MRFPKIAAAATLASALVLVAGCGSTAPTDVPTTTAPHTPSAQPTPKPTPQQATTAPAAEFDATVPPDRPESLDAGPSEATARAAAIYFISLFPYAFATGDLDEWRAMSGKSCEYCSGIVGQVESEQAAGKRREGGRIEFLDVTAIELEDEQYVVGATIKEHEGRLLRADGSVEKDTDYVLDARMELLVSWSERGWLVEGLEIKWSGKA